MGSDGARVGHGAAAPLPYPGYKAHRSLDVNVMGHHLMYCNVDAICRTIM